MHGSGRSPCLEVQLEGDLLPTRWQLVLLQQAEQIAAREAQPTSFTRKSSRYPTEADKHVTRALRAAAAATASARPGLLGPGSQRTCVLAGAPQNQSVIWPCGKKVKPALLQARYELFALNSAPRACLQCGGHPGDQAERAPLCCPCQQIAQQGLRCAAVPHHSLRVQARPQPGAACLSLLQARMPECWQACQQVRSVCQA